MFMPGLDEIETCRILKASTNTREVLTIFVAVFGETVNKAAGLDASAIDYFTKLLQPPTPPRTAASVCDASLK